MKLTWVVLALCAAAVSSTVVQNQKEKKLAGEFFLKRQQQVLDLFVYYGGQGYFSNEYSDWDFQAHSDQFTYPYVVNQFFESYKRGLVPFDQVFSFNNPQARNDTIRLFDVFFFAKDFDVFYKAASWAKKYVHPGMFTYAYTLALMHREDCFYFELPPFYEIFPQFFVPQEALYKVYEAKMKGIYDYSYTYNNTGYEYNYYTKTFGGPYGLNAYAPHLEHKVSYFREDVGMNSYYSLWHFRYPEWMNPQKYGKSNWFKRGEGFYYTHQQLFARYSLERIANGLPWTEPLYWDKPIKAGYYPRISHFNGKSFIPRPDNFEMDNTYNNYFFEEAQKYEQRIFEAIDNQAVFDMFNQTLISLMNEDGIDVLGKIIYGSFDAPQQKYFGNYFWTALEAIGYSVKTQNDYDYNGGATLYSFTAMRDPAFYNFLYRLNYIFQSYKKFFNPYTRKELGFPGVTVKDIEFDKLLTYFEQFDYDVSNGVAVKDVKEYKDLRYYVRQYRLNHKPFTYKVTVNSDSTYDGIVRVFIGPKFDSEGRVLTFDQKRQTFFELDRFPVKISAGVNTFERFSKEFPMFDADYTPFKALYNKVNVALKSSEPYYYYTEKYTCGMPERFQLPQGYKNGSPYTVYVIVSPYEKYYSADFKPFYATCGSSKLYDYRPLGFPFDRTVNEYEFNVPNSYFKDVYIYHQDYSGEYEYESSEFKQYDNYKKPSYQGSYQGNYQGSYQGNYQQSYQQKFSAAKSYPVRAFDEF